MFDIVLGKAKKTLIFIKKLRNPYDCDVICSTQCLGTISFNIHIFYLVLDFFFWNTNFIDRLFY